MAIVKRALISVSDKTGVVELAKGLASLGAEILSTGGTAKALREAGLTVTDVAAYTGSPEILDGRVKTLHPKIHAGILADRRKPEHVEELEAHAIEPFDLVVVNLYPFRETVAGGAPVDEVIEKIDIGGPALVRAAAKNFESVGVVVSPERYPRVVEELRREGLARDLVRLVQDARKAAGLEVTDRIALGVEAGDDIAEALSAFRDYVAAETLATEVADRPIADAPFRREGSIEGSPVTITLRPA